MRKKQYPVDIFIGINFALLFIALAVVLVINFRPLYYLDIRLLDIPAQSGYSRSIIVENYNALIDYCSPFFQGPLNFPSLAASPSGLQHFEEVKVIFTGFYLLLGITLLLGTAAVLYKRKRQDYRFLKTVSLTSVLLPLITGAGMAVNFDKAFYLFHKLFFRNDYWLFDPVTDPVITLLPDTYFLHCGVFLILLVLLCSLGSYLLYRHLHKKRAATSA